MNRAAQNFALLLIGAAVLKISLDGTFLRYVRPGLQPYLVASGVALLLLAAVAIVRDIRGHDEPRDHADHHPGRPQWPLLAPIAALLIIVPPALGASSVQSGATAAAGIAAPASGGGRVRFAPLPAGPAPTIRMYDLIDRAAYDSSGELDRRQITVQGFVIRTEEDGSARTDGTHTGFDLARVVITCCAADAQTLRIHLDGAVTPLPDDTWVSVQGRVVPNSATPQDNMTPTVTVTRMQMIPPPARVYG
ncbi:TIGR03943 family protein [Nocardia sp. CA2R105]|uniref:TIGR03943 family putative permease subunit n=1 Tax=Nocardia coffeae TaxID=2873381 RepID=UPI001CA7623A|nr:TIGR03943 family protein [Nocardia coffeae]MBY8860465.1 TIGR03943 family protein [Nocardia coffeae]